MSLRLTPWTRRVAWLFAVGGVLGTDSWLGDTPTRKDARVKESFRRQIPLLLILLVAFATRLVWTRFLTGAIHTEAAEYARIAQNLVAGKGYVGIATEGPELMFPPLFPLLIVIASRAIHDWQMASQWVSIIMGALLVLPVFRICQLLYDDSVAFVGALLAGLHPLLIHISAQGISEAPYLTLLMIGTYYSLRAIKCPAPRDLLWAGLFFGFAYLTRPEAFMYPFFATGFVLLAARLNGLPVTRRVGLLLSAFLMVATPYITFLSLKTGQFRVEGKTPIIYRIPLKGEDKQSPYAIGDDLKERGVWMRSNLSIISETHLTIAGIGHYAAVSARRNLPAVADTLASAQVLGSPLLFAFAIIGLFRKRWTRELTSYQALLVALMLLQVLALLSKGTDIQSRYYCIFLPIMLVWAAKGIVELSRWARATHGAAVRQAVASALPETVTIAVSVAVLWLVSLVGIRTLVEFRQFGPQSRLVRETGVWLKRLTAEPITVMDTHTNLAFHAGATYVPFPECDPTVALRYLDKKKVDFIILRESSSSSRGYLQDWLEGGIPDRRAQLIYCGETPILGRLRIFKWNSEVRVPIHLAPPLLPDKTLSKAETLLAR